MLTYVNIFFHELLKLGAIGEMFNWFDLICCFKSGEVDSWLWYLTGISGISVNFFFFWLARTFNQTHDPFGCPSENEPLAPAAISVGCFSTALQHHFRNDHRADAEAVEVHPDVQVPRTCLFSLTIPVDDPKMMNEGGHKRTCLFNSLFGFLNNFKRFFVDAWTCHSTRPSDDVTHRLVAEKTAELQPGFGPRTGASTAWNAVLHIPRRNCEKRRIWLAPSYATNSCPRVAWHEFSGFGTNFDNREIDVM